MVDSVRTNPGASGKRMKGRVFVLLGASLGLVGVVLGAFGSHALEARLSADQLASWETAVQYHLLHAVVLLWLGTAARTSSGRAFGWAGWALFAGVVLFSGSIYAYTLGAPRWTVMLAPVGGLSLMAGWALCFAGAWQERGN